MSISDWLSVLVIPIALPSCDCFLPLVPRLEDAAKEDDERRKEQHERDLKKDTKNQNKPSHPTITTLSVGGRFWWCGSRVCFHSFVSVMVDGLRR